MSYFIHANAAAEVFEVKFQALLFLFSMEVPVKIIDSTSVS